MKVVTRANLEALQALAQEGIQLSEEELLLTARSQPHGLGPANGAVASPPRVPWYVAVLCRLGIHEGPCGYLAEGQCTQMRECSRCGAIRVRTKHQREWRYTGERTCNQTRICTRCNAVSGLGTMHEPPARVEHQREWGYVGDRRGYVGDRTCNQTRICTRCNAISGYRTRHEAWSDWRDVKRYTDAHRCLRCGAVETRDTSPD